MIATRFTADQLVPCPEHAGNGEIANLTITFCKMLQHAYPNARFAVDGRYGGSKASNRVDYRGRVDVFVSVDGPFAGRIDVSNVSQGWRNSIIRYTFEGPYVDKGEANYHGEGKVWRKDPIKLVEAIQKQDCLRDKNPLELYLAGREKFTSSARNRVANLEQHAGKLLRLAGDESLRMAMGLPPSHELAVLAKAAKSDWKETVFRVQEDLERQNNELAAQHGIQPWKVEVLNYGDSLRKVLERL